jgi:hypothetical protein
MVRSKRWALAVLAASVSCAINCNTSCAASAIVVETVDGRTLNGVVDARSDQQSLWVRQEEGNVVLRLPVDWEDIASTTVDGAAVGVDEMRQRLGELASEGPRWLIPEAEVPVDGVAKMQAGGSVYSGMRAGSAAPHAAGGRVRNLEVVGAGLVNLDRDVAPDGLSVSIVAVGYDGLPVAVRGNLRAELHGERRSVGDPAPRFDELGRWSQRVRSEDFVDGVATYCLPFRGTAPEWEFDIMPDAVLTVQLGATGHGNYSASAPVALRKFNPLRDDLQQWEGTRFLPNELGGWRPQAPLGGREGMWLWWGR